MTLIKEMGLIATQLADHVIFTDEDPKSEKPENIISSLTSSVTKSNYEVIHNRKDAIKKAFEFASNGDCILVTGKGNESYMQYDGYKIQHNDIETCKELISNIN